MVNEIITLSEDTPVLLDLSHAIDSTYDENILFFELQALEPGELTRADWQTADAPRRVPELAVSIVPDVQRYLFEPHPAVIAAQLTGALAERYGLQPIGSGVAYLSGDRRLDSPLWSVFEAFRYAD